MRRREGQLSCRPDTAFGDRPAVWGVLGQKGVTARTTLDHSQGSAIFIYFARKWPIDSAFKVYCCLQHANCSADKVYKKNKEHLANKDSIKQF